MVLITAAYIARRGPIGGWATVYCTRGAPARELWSSLHSPLQSYYCVSLLRAAGERNAVLPAVTVHYCAGLLSAGYTSIAVLLVHQSDRKG